MVEITEIKEYNKSILKQPVGGAATMIILCKVEDCNNVKKTAGYCNAHYIRQYRHGSLEMIRGTIESRQRMREAALGNTRRRGSTQSEETKRKLSEIKTLGKPYPKKYYKGSIYNTWASMKRRCLNPKSIDYKNYGARGITICDRWLEFGNFLDDMLDTHFEGSSIDRIDNDCNYEPSNCRWATNSQQSNNTRRNRKFDHKGKKMSITQLAEMYGLKRSTVSMRYYKYNWSIDECLKPVRKKR